MLARLAPAVLVLAAVGLAACGGSAAPALVAPTAPALTLAMGPGEGTNGAAVAHDPASGRYFAALAGNEVYPLAAFSATGARLGADEARADLRGLWWNARAGRLEGHGLGGGLVAFALRADGTVERARPAGELAVPTEASGGSVGAYLPDEDALAFLDAGRTLVVVGRDGAERRRVRLALPVGPEAVNPSGVVWTGVRGREVGVVGPAARALYLFDGRSGALAQTLPLPVRPADRFGVAYAGGHLWLYDTDARVWSGFRITR